MGHFARPAEPELSDLSRWRASHREGLASDGPSVDEIASLLADDLPAAERAATADRIVASRRGADDFLWLADLDREATRLLASTARASSPSTELPAPARPRRRPRIAVLAALAAALTGLTLAGLGLYRHTLVPPRLDVLRGEASVRVSPALGAELTEPPEALAWPALPGASSYRVVLRDARARILWRSDPLPTPRAALPPAVRRTLTQGGAFLWTVQIEGDAARNRLGPFTFRIAPPE